MARNEEKAQAMLNKFVAAKKEANRPDMSKRPYLSTEVDNVPHCEVFRNQIIKEISKKVSLIQNEGLEEHKVRDLNDAINKLMREKGHWERQIKTLGGPDYFRTAPKMLNDEDAEEVVPGKGYRYYGAAKKLPGVRELFSKVGRAREREARRATRRQPDFAALLCGVAGGVAGWRTPGAACSASAPRECAFRVTLRSPTLCS
eukprot:7377164-Prymnesium_polylepis.1